MVKQTVPTRRQKYNFDVTLKIIERTEVQVCTAIELWLLLANTPFLKNLSI